MKAPLLAVAFVLVAVVVAQARPPPGADPDSPIGMWFRKLMRPDTNTSCCDASDCRRVESRMTPSGWAAHIGSTWMAVPPDRVLRQENPVGEAVACYLPWLGIICFVPPAQS